MSYLDGAPSMRGENYPLTDRFVTTLPVWRAVSYKHSYVNMFWRRREHIVAGRARLCPGSSKRSCYYCNILKLKCIMSLIPELSFHDEGALRERMEEVVF